MVYLMMDLTFGRAEFTLSQKRLNVPSNNLGFLSSGSYQRAPTNFLWVPALEDPIIVIHGF